MWTSFALGNFLSMVACKEIPAHVIEAVLSQSRSAPANQMSRQLLQAWLRHHQEGSRDSTDGGTTKTPTPTSTLRPDSDSVRGVLLPRLLVLQSGQVRRRENSHLLSERPIGTWTTDGPIGRHAKGRKRAAGNSELGSLEPKPKKSKKCGGGPELKRGGESGPNKIHVAVLCPQDSSFPLSKFPATNPLPDKDLHPVSEALVLAGQPAKKRRAWRRGGARPKTISASSKKIFLRSVFRVCYEDWRSRGHPGAIFRIQSDAVLLLRWRPEWHDLQPSPARKTRKKREATPKGGPIGEVPENSLEAKGGQRRLEWHDLQPSPSSKNPPKAREVTEGGGAYPSRR
mmetsp:Transcript_12313/g.21349  ORF Transcript_12313/g.21349 Transcript_12313/m.21349 type:complete len:342 (-) Transcript_12313:431-1456(-)